MRLLVFAAVFLVGVAGVLASGVLQPPPVGERLPGVGIRVQDFRIEDLGGDRHRLHVGVVVTSVGDIDECLAFALDEPFAGRRLESAGCIKPRTQAQTAALVFEHLSETDLDLPAHTLVWGVPGGRCGLVFQAIGICVVDVAGTAELNLPPKFPLPTFGPIGSFGPIVPIYSFPAP